MGYYVKITSGKIFIPAQTKASVLSRWKQMNGKNFDHLKRGGSFKNGEREAAWYSWMPADYDKTMHSVEAILDALGFSYESDESGVTVYDYDNKTGQEELFFAAVHKLVYGMVEWEGEDGETWIWSFPQSQFDPHFVNQSLSDVRENVLRLPAA